MKAWLADEKGEKGYLEPVSDVLEPGETAQVRVSVVGLDLPLKLHFYYDEGDKGYERVSGADVPREISTERSTDLSEPQST